MDELEQCEFCGKTELTEGEFISSQIGGMICTDCSNDLTEEEDSK